MFAWKISFNLLLRRHINSYSEKENEKNKETLHDGDELSNSQFSADGQEAELDQGGPMKLSNGEHNGVPQHWRRRTAESLKPKVVNPDVPNCINK